MTDTLFVEDFGDKTRFLARLPTCPSAAGIEALSTYSSDRDFAAFFCIKPTRWSNWRKTGMIHRAFEIALAIRYGFSPSAEFLAQRRPMPLRQLYDEWFSEHWRSWRTDNAKAFQTEMLARLEDADPPRPRPASDSELLEAIADIPNAEDSSDAGAAQLAANAPSLPAQPVNQLVELVSLSAGFPDGNNPESGRILLVSLNANVEKLEDSDRVYSYRLNAARLDLRCKATMPRPIGWSDAGPHPAPVGTSGCSVRVLSAPPAAVVWRVDGLDSGTSQVGFSYVDFGTLVGETGPTDALLLKVREADISVSVDSPELGRMIARMSINKRKVWKNVIVKAALESDDSDPYQTLCSQPLGRVM